MEKNVLKVLLAGAVVLVGMVMTSCSNIDVNGVVVSQDDGNSEIYQDPGLEKIHENQFITKVPALTSGFDQRIVDALMANPNITDVKPFMRVYGVNPDTEKYESGVAYFFNYIQDIDHNNPKLGTFKQQCVLAIADKDRPTVLNTHGYGLGNGAPKYNFNRIDSLFDSSLVPLLDANSLHIEHRYHGWSLPEGWTNRWNYLNTKQQSDDLHAIVTAIKQSGIISEKSKWLSTGVSKDGMTTTYYAFHYPNEMDAYIPFCAPFLTQLKDERTYRYILNEPALENIGVDNVKDAFVKYCSDKDLQSKVTNLYIQKYYQGSVNVEEKARKELLSFLFNHHFKKMSYVSYKYWKPLIPKKDETNAQVWLDFILANEDSPYQNEKQWEYWRRLKDANDEPDYADDDTDDDDETAGARLTRSASLAERDNPYNVQCFIDLGEPIIVFDWVEDILTAEEKAFIDPINKAEDFGVTYDGGAFVKSLLEGMKTSNCHMLFVYGTQDPWTGGRIPDENLGENSMILMIENGTHNDYIDQWNKLELSTLTHWLDELGFMAE